MRRCLDDPTWILVGEAKRSATLTEARQLLADLRRKASVCPPLQKLNVFPILFIASPRSRLRDLDVVDANDVMRALR